MRNEGLGRGPPRDPNRPHPVSVKDVLSGMFIIGVSTSKKPRLSKKWRMKFTL